MPATLADVARRAQVSKSTVSNVVRGSDVVAPATRRRVEDAIRELRYRPDGVARALRRRSTGLIGLVVPDAVNPFYAQLAVGIERELRRFGHGLVMANTVGDPAVVAAQLEALLERLADGVIIGGLTRGSRLERREVTPSLRTLPACNCRWAARCRRTDSWIHSGHQSRFAKPGIKIYRGCGPRVGQFR